MGASILALAMGCGDGGADPESGGSGSSDESGVDTSASSRDTTGETTPSGSAGTTTSGNGSETGADDTSGTSDTGMETETGEPVAALEIVVVGQTDSGNFPVSPGAPEPSSSEAPWTGSSPGCGFPPRRHRRRSTLPPTSAARTSSRSATWPSTTRARSM